MRLVDAAADQRTQPGPALGGELKAGDSVTLSSCAGPLCIPAHVGEPAQQSGGGLGVEGVTGQCFGPYEGEVEAGGEVGCPQGDQPGNVVGLAW
ncbi:hypothetical protein ACWEWL_32710 [Streptomyces rochei]